MRNDQQFEARRSRRRIAALLLSKRWTAMLLTLGALVAIGALATQALLSDQVSMAAVSTTGGTLDIKVSSNTTANQDGPNANWGTFTASLSNMKPGDTRYADITLANPGSLAATVTASTVGSETHASDPGNNSCFAFYFRERATGADVQSIGNGTVTGTAETNAGVVGFSPSIAAANGQLYTDGATRTTTAWASGESHVYRLTVRMLDGCLQGSGKIGATMFASPVGATGSLTFTFDAAQTPGSTT